jgi:hypothetical protein
MSSRNRVRSVLDFLTRHVPDEGFALLSTERRTGAAPANLPAALLASGRFDVAGFTVSGHEVRCEDPVPAWVHPFLYLAELLVLNADEVTLLFGPRGLNDMMMHQFEPMPQSAYQLQIARLEYYLREGTPVCNL